LGAGGKSGGVGLLRTEGSRNVKGGWINFRRDKVAETKSSSRRTLVKGEWKSDEGLRKERLM